MVKATVDDVLQVVEQLTPNGQARVREHIERLASTHHTEDFSDENDADQPTASPHVRPGLADHLAVLERLAAKIGAAWKTERSAPEAVSDMRRDL